MTAVRLAVVLIYSVVSL